MNIDGGRLSFDAYIKDSDFKKQLAAMEQKIIGLSSTTEKQAKRMDDTFSKLAKSAAAFLTISQANNFVQQLIKVRSEFQQLEIAFTTMLGSKEKADQLTKDLIEFASTTPFGMSDAANAAKQLLAYGSAAETVTDELRMLGDVAAGTSQPIGDLVYLYGTLRTQGRAYTQDIRQFAGRGIPIYKELARVLGVAEDQVNSLVTSGRVGFAEIEQAFRNMTAAGSMFGGLMEAQSQTIAGELERLGDAVEQMFNEIGQESEGMIGMTIQGLSALVENYRTILDVLTGLIVTYGVYRAAVLATAAAQSIATATTKGWTVATMLQYRGLVLAEAAQKLLNRTMLANPYVAVTTAVAGLAFALYKLSNNLSTAEAAQKRVNDLSQEANSSVVDQTVKLNDLIRVAQNENNSKKEREKAIRAMNKISPEYLGNINLETINTKAATDAVNNYVEALKAKAFEEAAFNERVAIERERMQINANGAPSNFVQRAGMWIYGVTGGNRKAMQEAAKKEAIEALDAREKALDDELKKRAEESAKKGNNESLISVTQRLAELNAEITTTEASLKSALSPDAKYDKSKIESLQESLKNLRSERDLLMGKTADGDKALKEIEQWGEKKIDILQKITDQENDLRIASLSQDEQEIERAKAFYAELRRIIEEHNAKAPKGQQIGPGTIARIDNLEVQEVGFLTSEQRVKKDLENIAKLDKAADQLAALNSRINALEGKKFSMGFSLLPGEESELRQYQEQAKKLKEQQDKDLQDLLATLITYESQRENLIKEYQKKRLEIEAEGNAENLQVFDRLHQEALAKLDDENVQKLDSYKDLFEGIEGLSDAMARKVIANARAMLAGLVSSGKISKDLAKEIEKQIKDTQKALDDRLPDRLDQLAAGFDQMAGSVSGLNDGLSSTLGLLSDALRAVGQVQNGIKGLTAGISNYKDNKAAGGGGIVGSISAIAGIAGPVGQIVGAVSGVVGGIIKILGAARRAREEARKYQLEIMAGEIDLNRAMRERARTQQNINDPTREEILLRGQLLEQQKQQAQSDYDRILAEIQKGVYESGTRREKVPGTGFFGIGAKYMDFPEFSSLAGFTYEQLEELYFTKKLSEEGVKLFEQLQRAKKEVDDIAAAWDEGVEFIKDRMTGAISADSIADNIKRGLREGKRAWADFADDAEDMIKEALLSAMEFTVLKEPIQKLLEQFREDSLDGLDENELEAFRNAYRSIVETGLDAIKDLEKITGPLGGKKQGEFSKGIQSLTESTGGRIEGELGGLRLANLEALQVARQQAGTMAQQVVIMNNKLAVLNAINQNTGRTADNTDRLANIEAAIVSMNSKIASGDAIRRGGGL